MNEVITPLAYMNEVERVRAREEGVVVDNPYTDDSYQMVLSSNTATSNNNTTTTTATKDHHAQTVSTSGGISEAHARRLIQQHSAQEQDYRWNTTNNKKRKHNSNEKEDELLQKEQANNPNNTSLFLHGLHRDAMGVLSYEVLMDAFRPFGCHTVRYPRSSSNTYTNSSSNRGGGSSYVFLDFNSHDEALACLQKVKGEVAIRNVLLTLKWSNPTTNNNRGGVGGGDNNNNIPPKRKQRLTEREAADSSTLFLRLPSSFHDPSTVNYANEMEIVRQLAEQTMEDELNIGIPADSPDRITAMNEPALKVLVRQPDADKNYGFLQFDSHTAALTTLISLTGNEDGGYVSADKLSMYLTGGSDDDGNNNSGKNNKNASHLEGIALHWANDSQPKNKTDSMVDTRGHRLGQRTDCWFCLASPTCEKHLIVAIREECYIAMPKGAVNEHHALIVPIDHKQQGALVDSKLSPEMEGIKAELRSHARHVLKKDLFVFERCIQTRGGYHTHVQCIPVDQGLGPVMQSKMMEMAIGNNFKLKEITSDLGLPALGGEWDEGYFYAEIPLPGGGGYRRFVYNAAESGGGNVPLQFGREIIAAAMGDERISQWKACLVSHEKEEELTVAFRKSFEQSKS